MSLKGGYQILDVAKITNNSVLTGSTNEFEVKGIYKKFQESSKVVLVSGLKVHLKEDEIIKEYHDFFSRVFLASDDSAYFLENIQIAESELLKIRIESNDKVIFTIEVI